MSLFKKYKTDAQLEAEGVLFNLGEFKVRLRRVGGANKKGEAAVKEVMAPYTVTPLDKEEDSVQQEALATMFVKACYVEHSWETKVDGKFERGILDEEDKLVPATTSTVIRILKQLPELRGKLQDLASTVEHYKAAQVKAAVENLPQDSSGN